MLLATVLVTAFLLAVFLFLFRRLASRVGPEAVMADWLDSFSIETYAPMARLLDQKDFDFLAAQPGYDPEIAKRLLSERRKVFTAYLQQLVCDFNRLHSAARLVMVHSSHDLPEFAKALWRQQLRFFYMVSLLRCKLALYPWGWKGVDLAKIMEPLQTMRTVLQNIN